ncbi:unnamed protein product [Ixodes hexagonus]
MSESSPSNGSDDPLRDLRSRLEAENDYMLKLVDTIEPKYYFDQDTVDTLTSEVHQKVDERVKASKRMQKMSVHGKHKLARLDPSTFKTVSQILHDQGVESGGLTEKQALKKLRRAQKKKAKMSTLHSVALDRASNLDELKHRLTEKIEALKGARKTPVIQSREERKAKKLAEKKAAKKNKNKGPKVGSEDITASGGDSSPKKLPPGRPAPIFNREGKMVFSKFDLADSGIPDTEERKKAFKSAAAHSNQPKKLMRKLEVEAQKLKTLEDKDPEQAKEVKQKKQWLKAMDKAQGVKVKDDPELLKRSMKRQQKLRQQSQKKWQARLENTAQKQKERQDKRRENLKARKQAKLQTKMKRLKKKGRIIPGF